MLEAVLGHAGLLDALEDVVSADEVHVYKPSPHVYAHGALRLGLPPERVWLVSANPFDCAGAKAAGLGVAKIERAPVPLLRLRRAARPRRPSPTELVERLA